MRRPARPRLAAGMTLLEMLVTLVIVAAVSALLMQTLVAIAGLEDRLADLRGETEERLMQRYWVQQSIASIVPARTAQKDSFEGQPHRFGAWVANPPWVDLAGPVWTELRLEQETEGWSLIAHTAGLPDWVVATDLAAGELQYLVKGTHGLEWRSQWSPPAYGMQQALRGDQAELGLPRAIRLRGAAPWLEMQVVIHATRNPQLSRSDLLLSP